MDSGAMESLVMSLEARIEPEAKSFGVQKWLNYCGLLRFTTFYIL